MDAVALCELVLDLLCVKLHIFMGLLVDCERQLQVSSVCCGFCKLLHCQRMMSFERVVLDVQVIGQDLKLLNLILRAC